MSDPRFIVPIDAHALDKGKVYLILIDHTALPQSMVQALTRHLTDLGLSVVVQPVYGDPHKALRIVEAERPAKEPVNVR